jgi:hypothetical protein
MPVARNWARMERSWRVRFKNGFEGKGMIGSCQIGEGGLLPARTCRLVVCSATEQCGSQQLVFGWFCLPTIHKNQIPAGFYYWARDFCEILIFRFFFACASSSEVLPLSLSFCMTAVTAYSEVAKVNGFLSENNKPLSPHHRYSVDVCKVSISKTLWDAGGGVR